MPPSVNEKRVGGLSSVEEQNLTAWCSTAKIVCLPVIWISFHVQLAVLIRRCTGSQAIVTRVGRRGTWLKGVNTLVRIMSYWSNCGKPRGGESTPAVVTQFAKQEHCITSKFVLPVT